MLFLTDSSDSINPYSSPSEKTFVEGDLTGSIAYPEPNLQPTHILKSQKLGSGKVISLIGSGGMAYVYKIWNEKLEVYRAVKILNCDTENLKLRFQTESIITAKLDHPYIVKIYDVGDWNGFPYIEMEYIDGSNLQNFISVNGKLPAIICSAIAIQITRALHYAHNEQIVLYNNTYHGIIHRDLKPANIMISNRGEIRILDFGIARPTEKNLHTTSGNFVGTLHYLSPEQIDGINVDLRTDIYSLGIIFYEMITGTKMLPEDCTTSALIKSKLSNNYIKLPESDYAFPKEITKIIHRCLQPDKNNRYPDTAMLLSDLIAFHKSSFLTAPSKAIKEYLCGTNHFSDLKPSNTNLKKLQIIAITTLTITFILMACFLLNAVKTSQKTIIPIINDTSKVTFSYNPASVTSIPASKISDSIKRKHDSLNIKPKIISVNKTTMYNRYNHGRKLFFEKNYAKAVTILELIPQYHPKSMFIKLMLIEGYLELGRLSEAKIITDSLKFSDAQYDLLCGRLHCLSDNLKSGLECFQNALTKSSSIRDTKEIRNDALFCIAETWSKIYSHNPDKDTESQMLNAWRVVKNIYKNNTGHPRFIIAAKILPN